MIPVRRELAVRTIFNMLGPLTNPAGARRQLIGVSDPGFLETMAGALALLGVDRALVVSAEDGLDEVSASAPTQVVEVNGEEMHQLRARRPSRPGSAPARRPRRGAHRRRTPRSRKRSCASTAAPDGPPPGEELALINAGAAIYVAGAADTIAEGVEAARARPRRRPRRRGPVALRGRHPQARAGGERAMSAGGEQARRRTTPQRIRCRLPSVLERIVAQTRAEVERRKPSCRCRSSPLPRRARTPVPASRPRCGHRAWA